MIVITLQTCDFPSCCGYLNIVQCPGITWTPCEVYAKFIKHLSVQEGLKIAMFGHFTICEVLTSYCSVVEAKKKQIQWSIMTTTNPDQEPGLSLRSNTSIPTAQWASEQPDSDAPSNANNPSLSDNAPTSQWQCSAILISSTIWTVTIAGEYTVIKAISSGIVHRSTVKVIAVILVLIPGVLLSIQNLLWIPDSTSGLLQTGISLSLKYIALPKQ